MALTAEQLLKESQRRTRSVRSTSAGIRKYKMARQIPEDYIVLDFETTGPRPGADRIIQIGAIKYINNKKTEVYHTLINPRRYIPTDVTKRTNLTNYLVEDAPLVEDKIVELIDFIEGLPVVTHNASLHMNFLYAIEYLEGVEIPAYKVIDTARLARKSLSGFTHQKLEKLTEYLQQEYEAQDMISNCEAIHKIYQLCIDK
ncbi:exonuclease domain-containing protein [Sporosarcina ureilytica]|uniref:Exonuclease domain-containing protein n=1 Tax=Sporosarcina ureilytica TaxID=298596 RepID=A0A1D8JJC6_9BACL|nr:exonuclease domain-containing protein [Sporosarcina ureilytica]AOV08805.1 hypothetical protein BI350_15465 [Sporosarcina ureilytica]